MERIEMVTAQDRTSPAAGQTHGMLREQAFASEGICSGVVFTEPGLISGWHHHGEHDTYFYVAAGRAVLEFGPGGRDKVDAGPGDYVHVPRHTVHRESNPIDTTSALIVFRMGSGEVVINVEAPQS